MPQTLGGVFPGVPLQRLLTVAGVHHAGGAATTAGYQLKENPWSQANARVHFTPLWYPDGPYKVFVTVRDMWTPVGELKQATTDTRHDWWQRAR